MEPLQPPAEHSELPVLVIAASAANDAEINVLLGELGPAFPAAVVVVLDDHPPFGADQTRRRMEQAAAKPVRSVEGGAAPGFAPNTIDLVIAGHGGGPSSAEAITTLARGASGRLIAVLVESPGCRFIGAALGAKAHGGLIISPREEHAEIVDGDMVVPSPELGARLRELCLDPMEAPRWSDNEPREFHAWLARQTGFDVHAASWIAGSRQLRWRMRAAGVSTLAEYRAHLADHPAEAQEMVAALLHRPTGFAREWQRFSGDQEAMIDGLLTERPARRPVRVWCAGVGTGESAVAIASTVRLVAGDGAEPARVFATDHSGAVIRFARRGVYPAAAIEGLAGETMERAFSRVDDGYEVRKEVRSLIVFGEHDLFRRAPFPRTDLVVAPPWFSWLTSDAVERSFQLFAYSLRPGGFLLLDDPNGSSPPPELFAPTDVSSLFRRSEAPAQIMQPRHVPVAGIPRAARPPVLEAGMLRSLTAPAERPLEPDYVAVLHRLRAGVIVVNGSFDIQYSNTAARALLGLRDLASGGDLLHAVDAPLAIQLRPLIESALRGAPARGVCRAGVHRGEDSPLHLSIRCVPVPAAERGPAAQIEIIDLSPFAEREHAAAAQRAGTAAEHEKLLRGPLDAIEHGHALQRSHDLIAEEVERLRAENDLLRMAHAYSRVESDEVQAMILRAEASNEEHVTLNEELEATVEELNTANAELEARSAALEAMAERLEARRQESEAWFRAVIEQAVDYAIFSTDAQRRIDSWPPGAAAVFGWEESEALGQLFDMTFTDEDRAGGVPEHEWRNARATGLAEDIRWHKRKDGSTVFIEGTTRARLSPDGEFQGLLKIGRDATGRLRAEEARRAEMQRVQRDLEARVMAATAEARALSGRLLGVQEEERRHLARELHDEIGQVLTGLGLLLGGRDRLDADRVAEAQRIVRELTEQVRQLSTDLRPPTLDAYGLLAALHWHLERFHTRTGIEVELRHEGIERRFHGQIEVAAYRVIQEALTNVARHSSSPSAIVQIYADEREMSISVRDSGNGFDPATAPPGSGIGGMRERVELLGGSLEIEAYPGAGVVVTAEIPIVAEAAADRLAPLEASPEY